MESQALIYIFGILSIGAVFSFFIWLYIRWKVRKMNKGIPQAVLDEHAEAIRMFEQAGGKKSQQDILFELAKKHFNYNSDKEVKINGRQIQSSNIDAGADKESSSGDSSTEIREDIDSRVIIPSGSVEQSAENNKRNKRNTGKFRKLPRI